MEIVLEGILVNSFPPLLYLKWNKRNDKLVNLTKGYTEGEFPTVEEK